MILIVGPQPLESKFTIEEITDPVENAAAWRRHEQAVNNLCWLSAHRTEIVPGAIGKYVAVAGQQAFVADTAAEARALAAAAHPDDGGLLVQYVSPLKGPRIYENRWDVEPDA